MPMAIQLPAPVLFVFNEGNDANLSSAGPDASSERMVLSPYLIRVEDDWLRSMIAGDRHFNVLVECSDATLRSAIAEICALCSHRSLRVVPLPGALELPDDSDETIVMGDVSTLTMTQQIALYDWFDRCGTTAQVLSFSTTPLWPLVERGRFMEALFYRLNVVTLAAETSLH